MIDIVTERLHKLDCDLRRIGKGSQAGIQPSFSSEKRVSYAALVRQLYNASSGCSSARHPGGCKPAPERSL